MLVENQKALNILTSVWGYLNFHYYSEREAKMLVSNLRCEFVNDSSVNVDEAWHYAEKWRKAWLLCTEGSL